MSKFTIGFIAQILTIFLFCGQQSFAINRIVSSLENADINISAESSTSTISLNNGGILNANIIMGNASQITTFNNGVLNGTINGSGKVIIAANTILNGNIGALNPISSLTINSGKILDLTANNNNSIAAAGNLNIANGGALLVGSGTVSASIQASSRGSGTVKFNANNTLGGSVGTSTTTLSLVEIASGVTLNTNTRGMDATAITIADNAIFNYGNGTINAAIDGKNSGVGNFIFNNTKTTTFNIGQNNRLANINIVDAATVTLGGNIAATNINIGGGSSGRLKSNGKNIIANNINIAKNATLEIASGSVINGAINGDISGNGIVQFSGGTAISQNNSLGATTKLDQVLISNETTVNINNNIIFNANEINIGEGSTGGVGTPILNQNNGIIGADENSLIKLNSNAIFNYNGGSINGAIRGTSSGKGDFNINSNYANNFKIGSFGSLANLNIASEKTLTANADISANNISVFGTLNLGNSSKIITGNLTTFGSSTIDLGSASHSLSGNFITSNGDILKLNAVNNSNIGNLKVAGNSLIADGLCLKIAFNSNDGYLSNGTSFAIVSSDSATINVIGDNNIDVNNSSLNQSGLLTFHTIKSGNNLLLTVDRKGSETFSDNKFAAKIYNNIDQVGANAKAELRDLQKIIDNTAINNKTKESALKSTIPQNNQDLNNGSFNSANSSVNIANQRLQNILFNPNQKNFNHFFNYKNFSNFSKKENIANLDKLSFGDDKIFDSQAIWMQGFSTSASQENVGDNIGYNYSNHGLAIGVDQEIIQDLRLGISSSFAIANSKSSSVNKKETDIDSYQFNLYGGYNFAPYFVTGILGVAINKYNSIRAMPELALQASANYGGETYIAKFETGMIQKLDYDLTITPKASLTAARNQIQTYNESGAGTLNLTISNQHSNFLEGRVGGDLIYDGLEIFKPKIKLSYGYDFLAQDQSSTNSFQGQNSSFEIKSSNIDKASLKYGLGFDVYQEDGVLVVVDYDVEIKASYKSKTGSIYLRYDF